MGVIYIKVICMNWGEQVASDKYTWTNLQRLQSKQRYFNSAH